MPISQIPIFSMLRAKMQWHQERQRLLAENVSNADTPKYTPRDLAPLRPDQLRPGAAPVAMVQTRPGHMPASGAGGSQFPLDRRVAAEVRPTGNAVSLEDEMLKVAANQMDYQAATALYARGLGLIKTALGRRS